MCIRDRHRAISRVFVKTGIRWKPRQLIKFENRRIQFHIFVEYSDFKKWALQEQVILFRYLHGLNWKTWELMQKIILFLSKFTLSEPLLRIEVPAHRVSHDMTSILATCSHQSRSCFHLRDGRTYALRLTVLYQHDRTAWEMLSL